MLRKTKKVNMNLQEAIKILKRHNKWRRGAVIEMENPTELGIAIDTILEYFEKQEKNLK